MPHDIHDRQDNHFVVQCHGDFHYLEDDPIFGIYSVAGTIELGRHGSIAEAMTAMAAIVHDESYPLDDDGDVEYFAPELVSIHDLHRRLVLSGQVVGQGIQWYPPAGSDDEARQLADQAGQLRSEASFEAGWDNFCTAASLRWQARCLEARLVDPFWREPARAAITAMAPPP